jgi:hypothetical protein
LRPRPRGRHACRLPSNPIYARSAAVQPPKGVGFPDPLSGTLNDRRTMRWATVDVLALEPRSDSHGYSTNRIGGKLPIKLSAGLFYTAWPLPVSMAARPRNARERAQPICRNG